VATAIDVQCHGFSFPAVRRAERLDAELECEGKLDTERDGSIMSVSPPERIACRKVGSMKKKQGFEAMLLCAAAPNG
jgi:hypothetical protein